jgi:hypothetical protein
MRWRAAVLIWEFAYDIVVIACGILLYDWVHSLLEIR